MKNVNENALSILDKDYQSWIKDLKTRFQKSQIKATVSVNSALLEFYFELGKQISQTSFKAKYGGKFYSKLSQDLTSSLENVHGFSPRNLRYIEQFYILYNGKVQILPQLVAQLTSIPWAHHRYIMDKCKDVDEALFYVFKTIENNWSRSVLLNFLDSNLYKREGKAINNFKATLPEAGSDLANQLTKDPYSFNFLSIDEKYKEKDLKKALVANIQSFLLELGNGFAFVGNEYRLEVGESELFIDMLFYNIRVHAYVVIEVKTGKFKPEYSGQLGTYVVAVDHQLRREGDNKTIGILVCKDKDNVVANYALESSSQPLGVSSYELSKLIPEDFKSSLPTIEEIERELSKK